MDRNQQKDIREEIRQVGNQMYTFDQIATWPASATDTRRLQEFLQRKVDREQLGN